MRTNISQYYGRGGARIRMSRPRIELEAWNQSLFSYVSDWRSFIRRIPELLFQTRFVNILAVILAIILFNYWLSSHYHHEIHQNIKKIEREQKLKLVLQYQAAPKKIPPKPKPILVEKPKPKVVKKPKPKPLPPKPVTEKTILKFKPVVQRIPKPISKSKPVVQQIPTPKPKPVKKKAMNLEASLKMDKQFDQPLVAKSNRRTRRKKVSAIKDDFNPAGMEMAGKKAYTDDYASTVKRRENQQVDFETKSDQIEADLGLSIATDKYQNIDSNSNRKKRVRSTKDRQLEHNQYEEVIVAIQEKDSYDYSEAQTTSVKPLVPVTNRTALKTSDKGQPEVKFSESGISLIQLKTCGPIEETIKKKLATLVRKKGNRKECIDETGNYKFYWPSERLTVQHFNVIIYTSQGRIATDRCEELNNACECLKNE
jgi:hypothetical protein